MLKNMKIGVRLFVGIALLLLAFALSVGLSVKSMQYLSQQTDNMLQHPVIVSVTAADLDYRIDEIFTQCRNMIATRDSEQRSRMIVSIDDDYQRISRDLGTIQERYLGMRSDIDDVRDLLRAFQSSVNDVIGKVQAKEFDAAHELLDNQGLVFHDRAIKAIAKIRGFAQARAARFAEEAMVEFRQSVRMVVVFATVMAIISSLIFLVIVRSFLRPIFALRRAVGEMTKGSYAVELPVVGNDEVGDLTCSIAFFSQELAQAHQERERQNWLRTGMLNIDQVLRGVLARKELCRVVLGEICSYAGAAVGAVYSLASDDTLVLEAGFAYGKTANHPHSFSLGAGLVGQVAIDKKPVILKELPASYIMVTSALGETAPVNILAYPVLLDRKLKLVFELGFLTPTCERILEWLAVIENPLAVAMHMTEEHEAKVSLLEMTQQQARELKVQQQELRMTLDQVQTSENRLRANQTELLNSNSELKQASQELIQQKEVIENRNMELKKAQLISEQKARDLDLANQYKTRFLANMSHELRTPLNSIMLLSQNLAKNKVGNLDASQIKALGIVHESGADLLALINAILDFSKIEARTIGLKAENINIEQLACYLRESFTPLAAEKLLTLAVKMDNTAPASIISDPLRLKQIVKNLLANAIKYTDSGTVEVTISGGESEEIRRDDGTGIPLMFVTVKDTGRGIQLADQRAVFNAFTQVGENRLNTSEGTGLGLSIARELAQMLGGDIRLVSEPAVGSTFTLFLPQDCAQKIGEHSGKAARQLEFNRDKVRDEPAAIASRAASVLPVDDRLQSCHGDKVILIIEDDIQFGQILVNLCREKGFKALHAHSAEEGLELLKTYATTGILLDIILPGMDGITLLDRIKDNLQLRHIPIHVMSVEEAAQTVLRKGALGFLNKPVTEEQIFAAIEKMATFINKDVKNILVIEDDQNCLTTLLNLLNTNKLIAHGARTAAQALDMIDQENFDCIVLDLGLPDMSGYELLRIMAEKHSPLPPVVINTGLEIGADDEYRLHKYAESIILKSVKSNERLLDEVTLFLHEITSELPPPSIEILQRIHDKDTLLRGKRALVIDDDIRNLYALASTLEDKGMEVLCAQNADKAYALLDENSDIAVVLTDIMMPGEDGYTVIAKLRERFEKLPIIALTAKVMKGDREKCLKVGASDYLPKPIDSESLLSMLARWASI